MADGLIRSTLQDALLVAGDMRKPNDTIHLQSEQLTRQIQKVKADYELRQDTKAASIEQIHTLLSQELQLDLLDGDFSALPETLLLGKRGCVIRERRRVNRLAERIKLHSLVFLQGEAGAGKSHLAKALSDKLRSQSGFEAIPAPVMISLGPETTVESLYGQQELRDISDGDSITEFEPGPILKWAMSTHPGILILDEANLAKEGILAALAGLTERPRRLCYQGNTYQLTDKHKIIMTGNPDFYDGRQMDPSISQRMLTIYCLPLSPEAQAELIIRPALPEHWSNEINTHACSAILRLYDEYQTLMPEGLSPRDLQEVLSRMRQTLRHSDNAAVNVEQVNALVLGAYHDALADGVPKRHSENVKRVTKDYQLAFPCDMTVIVNRDRAFWTFLEKLRLNNPKVDLESEPIIRLVQHYWLFLDKKKADGGDGGKRGLIVEGPAGWGKDLTLDRVLSLWEREHAEESPFIHINANPDNWEGMLSTIRLAMQDGKKLIVSEINLLPSRYLEGMFNELLTCPSHPGFMLFATVNPTSFGGREPLSQAFKNRCVQVCLMPLSLEELQGILNRRDPDKDKLVEWLSVRYQVLSKALGLNKSPMQLTINDLFDAMDKLSQTPKKSWLSTLCQAYSLSIESISWSEVELEIAVKEFLEAKQEGNSSERTKGWAGNSAAIMHVFQSAVVTGKARSKALKLDGDVTTKKHYHLTQHFACEWIHPSEYRLCVHGLKFVNGELQRVEKFGDDGTLESLRLPECHRESNTLAFGEIIGNGTFKLSAQQWVALPGYSTNDTLTLLQAPDGVCVNLAKNLTSGLLMVKLDAGMGQVELNVKLDFIVYPIPATSGSDDVIVNDDLCPETVRQALDNQVFNPNLFFNEDRRDLQRIKAIKDVRKKIKALSQWCNSFNCSNNAKGTGLELLINIMLTKQGVCKHRSWAFYILCQYFGVPVRIITNDCHSFAEISFDNEKTWHKVELGGGNGTVDVDKPNFLDFERPLTMESLLNNEHVETNIEAAAKAFITASPSRQKQSFRSFLTLLKKINLSEYYQIDSYLHQCDRETLFTHGHLIFLKALPELFQHWHGEIEVQRQREPEYHNDRISSFASQVQTYLSEINHMWESGHIPINDYIEFCGQCLPMMERGIPLIGTVLPILELLADDSVYKVRANRILDAYYQELIRPKDFSHVFEDEIKRQNSKLSLGGTSKLISNRLMTTRINSTWKWSPGSGAPKISRWAKKKPPFLHTLTEISTRKVVLCLPLEDTYALKYIFDAHLIKAGVNADMLTIDNSIDIFRLAKLGYFEYLAGNMTQHGGTCLVITGASCPTKGFFANLSTGHYTITEDSNWLMSLSYWLRPNCQSNITEHSRNNLSLNLNEERLQRVLNRPNAIIMQQKLIEQGFDDFLYTIDWSQILPVETA